MKLRVRLENFKGVFARMWFNIAMTSDRLSFASVEIDKSYSFTLPPWKNLCHRWSRDQPRPGSLFLTTRETKERDPGNEVVTNQQNVACVTSYARGLCMVTEDKATPPHNFFRPEIKKKLMTWGEVMSYFPA